MMDKNLDDPALAAAKRDTIYQLNRLAELQLDRKLSEEAECLLRMARDLDPGNPNVRNNLALVRQDLGWYPQALYEVYEGLTLKENHHQLNYTLGLISAKMGYRRGAIRAYQRCIELAPDCAPAHLNLALQYFYEQEWQRGWSHYEWRFDAHPNLGEFRQRFGQPHWKGEDLAGKRIVLYCEQGLGDFIQFIRYAENLKGRGAYVIVETPEELSRLFQGYWPIDEVALRPKDLHAAPVLPPHDFVVSVCSLPLYNKQLASFEDLPYLAPEGRWGFAKTEDARKRVALTWAGAAHHPDDQIRSFEFETFRPLADLNVDFYGIDKGYLLTEVFGYPRASPAPRNEKDFACFYETALFLKTIDLLITVDTAVAHLAGAMGRPVWLLLAKPHDWRWPLQGSTTHWYPTMRLFRQQKAGDWEGVIAEVKAALQEWLVDKGLPDKVQFAG